MTDVELLTRWRDGDTDAGQRLFERYYDAVSRFFESKLPDGIDDLVQQTFEALVARRDRIRKAASFRSYLFGTAHNLLREHLRRLSRERKRLDPDSVSAADLGTGPETARAREQWRRAVLEALRAIPIASQVVLELYYWEGLTSAELADVLQIPHATARTRLRRAREKLAGALERVQDSGTAMQSTLDRLERWAQNARNSANGSPP